MTIHEGQKLKYSMVIEWSDEDNAYIVTVPELPGCRTHGFTYEEAVEQGQEVIEGWIDVARSKGRPVPSPRTFVYWSNLSESLIGGAHDADKRPA